MEKRVVDKVRDKVKAISKGIPKSDAIKRQALIEEISNKLISSNQLKRGNSSARLKHAQEVANYSGVIGEINELGKKLGFRPIGLGQLRK